MANPLASLDPLLNTPAISSVCGDFAVNPLNETLGTACNKVPGVNGVRAFPRGYAHSHTTAIAESDQPDLSRAALKPHYVCIRALEL